MPSANSEQVTIVSIYPALLGTYGDAGNVLALRHRAALHGLEARIIEVAAGEPIPAQGDLYVLGGGEDSAQTAAARGISADGNLASAAAGGAAVLAICAGYQLLGEYFPDATGQPAAGLGMIDIRTDRLPRRAVGELAAESLIPGLPRLTGYENHGGATHLGAQVQPLARVLAGVGNGDGTEGAVAGHILGTYLHGPGLARNPALADLLLGWCIGRELEPIEEPDVEALREERLRTVLGEAWNRPA
ncbi:MAG: glutamine amidotransferase [Actinobacteria bacterium]|nr:glutamine amidotransferase [Actinomycetota bacterium]